MEPSGRLPVYNELGRGSSQERNRRREGGSNLVKHSNIKTREECVNCVLYCSFKLHLSRLSSDLLTIPCPMVVLKSQRY